MLIRTAIALVELRDIRFGLASREWKVARGGILRAFVNNSGNDGEGGELLHSANVRYVYKVGRREYASTRLSYGSTRQLKFGEAIRMLHGIVQGREVDVSRSPQAGSFRFDPGHRPRRHRPLRGVLSSGGRGGSLILLNPIAEPQQDPDERTAAFQQT